MTVEETAALFVYLSSATLSGEGMAWFTATKAKKALKPLFNGSPGSISDNAVNLAIEGYIGIKKELQ